MKNWWFSGRHDRNVLQTLSDEHILEFLRQHEKARKDWDEAFARCTPERQEELQELLDIVSRRDISPVLDPVQKSDLVQSRANRLAYFHGKPRKRKR